MGHIGVGFISFGGSSSISKIACRAGSASAGAFGTSLGGVSEIGGSTFFVSFGVSSIRKGIAFFRDRANTSPVFSSLR